MKSIKCIHRTAQLKVKSYILIWERVMEWVIAGQENILLSCSLEHNMFGAIRPDGYNFTVISERHNTLTALWCLPFLI